MTEPTTWPRVGRALLGSWPERVASWGEEGIAAYVEELQARAVTPDAALVAIRSCPATQKFPPSAPELAALSHNDPERPTPEEMYQQVYGPGGVFGVRRSSVVVSPWVLAFVKSYGRERMRMLEVDHDEYGGAKRRELREAYERFLAANEGRGIAAIAAGRREEGLARLDPAAALGIKPPAPQQIEVGS